MTSFFYFISTRTTYANYVPNRTRDQADFNRKTARAIKGNQGGFTRVGEVITYTRGDKPPNDHLLMDGSLRLKADYPELADFLGDSEGVAPLGYFKLPDGAAALAAAVLPAQTISGGTVSTGGAVTTPSDPGQVGGTTGGNVPTGGRTRKLSAYEQPL
jgi:hypothetical protein